ncbi:MAG: uridylate kinase, partial [Methylococcales bacterium]|nr:uridylate kinase [Methylococcales bacterium]
KLQIGQHPIIWLPKIHALNQAGIHAHWNITSDSLAAWLASKIQAHQLTLIKSTSVADNSNLTEELLKTDLVDAEFFSFTKKATFALQILSAGKFCHDEALKIC